MRRKFTCLLRNNFRVLEDATQPRGEMTDQTQKLTATLDAWKAVNPGAGQLRGVRDFRLLEDEWTSATRAVSLEMAKLQALGKGELEEQLEHGGG